MRAWVVLALAALAASQATSPAACAPLPADQATVPAAGASLPAGQACPERSRRATSSAADALPAHDCVAIDRYALAAPAGATDSIPALSAYLVAPARNEREMARAIFRWVAQFVTYDASAEATSLDPTLVLSRGRATCSGYAALFKALADAAGMKAETVVGHSKRFADDSIDGSSCPWNHSWNAVEADGQWRLVDCCWAAGHLDERGAFVRKFNPHYFMTAPEVFAYDHFPRDARWQLLDPPISKEAYLRQAHVLPPFFDCGLRLISHQSGQIETDNALSITIGAPPQTYLTAVLSRDGQRVAEQCTFAQRRADGVVIRALFPTAGRYILRVFARRGTANGAYAWALDYVVHARSGASADAGFPMTYESFLARNCQLEGAFSRVLPAGRTIEFALAAPGADDVVISTGGAWAHLSAQGSRFVGEVPVARGEVVVFARFAGQAAYEGLLQYHAQ